MFSPTGLIGLRDERAKVRIAVRIISAEKGNFGDCSPVGDGISEMRIHYGPGYRLYFTRRGEVIFCCYAAVKATQKRDIKRAMAMLAALKE